MQRRGGVGKREENPRKRPQESGGISGRTGETTLVVRRKVETELHGGKRENERERERDSEKGRAGGSVRWGRVGGCKCPRDVSDRCGSIQTPPPYYAT